jgi:hypothetical protein
MRKSTLQFGFLSACLFNLAPLSAQAQLTVNTTQNAAISGNNNQITQVVNQTIIYRPQNSSNRPAFRKDRERDERENHGEERGRNHHHKNHGDGSHGEREEN